MTIFNGKIKTRYGEYMMSTKYKALILLSKNVNVSKWFTDTYSNRGFIFMDCHSNLEDIRDALNINWPNGHVDVILIGDAKYDYEDDSEFIEWCNKYFGFASRLYLKDGLLVPSKWKNVEEMMSNNSYLQGEIHGWLDCAIRRDNELQ